MSWIEDEDQRMKSERDDVLKAKGYETLFKFPQGETRVKVFPNKEPKEVAIGERKIKIFEIETNGKAVSVGISQRSPLYRNIISQLIKKEYEFTVCRVGDGLATRYSIKA
jgi:hypothetical protein